MKTRKFTKLGAMLLAFVLCVTAVLGNGSTAKAADYTEILYAEGAATAGTPVSHEFTVTKDADVGLEIGMAGEPVGFNLEVLDSAGNLYNSFRAYAADSSWRSADGASYRDLICESMDAGDYTLVLTFDSDVADYYCYGIQVKGAAPATISSTKATITAGFTKKLTVSGAKVKSWTSSKKSVATVKNGKVTAKKAGKATITAKTEDGQTLKCVVTVKKNVYSKTKYGNASAPSGGCTMYVYKASYDKNGNLVMKARFINNYYYRVSSLKNIKVTMKTAGGKTIGTYSASSKSAAVSTGSYKDFTFTIKKSQLKIKKADLRNAKASCTGTYYYYY